MLSSHEGEAPLFVSTHSKILPLTGLEQGQPFAMSSFQAGVQQHSPACNEQGTLGSPGTSHPVQIAEVEVGSQQLPAIVRGQFPQDEHQDLAGLQECLS